MRMLPLLLVLVGCGHEYALSDGTPTPDAPAAAVPVSPQAVGSAAAPATSTSLSANQLLNLKPVQVEQGTAVRAFEDTVRGVREERFDVGGDTRTQVADYLFVIDNSSSMEEIIRKVRRGMQSLSRSGAFPKHTRIAVMSTLPSEPLDADVPHKTARLRGAAAEAPGFLRLVDGPGISHFREMEDSPRVRNRFALDGCSEAWFAPGQTNVDGLPCLLAHTQTQRTALRVEAGLVAVKQWLELADEPVFRQGAAVNVVFVSDTHDPGVPLDFPGAAELREIRPDFAMLEELVSANSLVSSFRVHAIAPATECVEPWSDGPTYKTVAEASGGVFLDVCTATDYRPVIRQIAHEGAVMQRAVLNLDRQATHVQEVRVGERAVGFTVAPDGRSVILDDAPMKQKGQVSVQYKLPDSTLKAKPTPVVRPAVRGGVR